MPHLGRSRRSCRPRGTCRMSRMPDYRAPCGRRWRRHARRPALQPVTEKRITVRAHDPLMQPCDASYGISGDGNTAFIEMAAISGLPLVPADKRNPMKTTTFGTGELIRDAFERGCLRFVIGLGGSATNDAGLGMLQALGFRFFGVIKKDTKWEAWKKGIAPMRCPFYSGNQLH